MSAVLLFSVLNREAAAETFYQFTDLHGVIHFSNVPTDLRYKRLSSGDFDSRPRRAHHKSVIPLHALHQTITDHSRLHRLDPALVRAVIMVESAFDPGAISSKGAVGLMQLMPQTAMSLQVSNPYDPEENVAGGVRHLRYLLDRFHDNVPLALAAYNAGESRVWRESRIPRINETQDYVKKVLRFYRQYSMNP